MAIKQFARREAKAALTRLGWGSLYQHKRGTEERWTLIAGCLSRDDRSVLDLGCNIGEFTSRGAELGLFALGLDKLKRRDRQRTATFWATNQCGFRLV